MYFLTSTARRLASVPSLPDFPPEIILCLRPSPKKSFFCSLTRNSVTLWRIRPPAALAHFSRSPTSIIDHGENVDAHWSFDGTRLVIQTSFSFLVILTVKSENFGAYEATPLAPNAQRNFLAGPGEGHPFHANRLVFEAIYHIEGTLLSVSAQKHSIFLSTKKPPTIQRIPWPFNEKNDERRQSWIGPATGSTWVVGEPEFPWLVEQDVSITRISYTRSIETWITSDGRVYLVHLNETVFRDGVPDQDEGSLDEQGSSPMPSQKGWRGTCIHDFKTPRWVQKQRQIDPEDSVDARMKCQSYQEPRRAVAVAVNTKFSLIAIGTYNGGLEYTNFPSTEGITPKSQDIHVPNPHDQLTGDVCCLEWTSDGYVLAVGWRYGWGIFSVGGRCLASGFGFNDVLDHTRFQDTFMYGVGDLFWAPGNFELVALAQASPESDGQLFVIPFAKSATTGQHSPDNTRYAFLQMDDRALVYRGADQPDISIINPEADVWQHIKIPHNYLSKNWPVRYSSLSTDGRLIAIAGRRGLIHYSSSSGRWKTFTDDQQEQAFAVKGGLLWFHHVLIAAVEVSKGHQICLYSRDMELSNGNILHREVLASPAVILSIVDNSLLVYMADNTLLHYLIVPTADTIKLHVCGSITFAGIISAPGAVRMLSWMIPTAQKQLGDPVDDLAVATVLMVVGRQLILLRPRKAANREVNYDMQIFADQIEFCWIHLRGIATLENSLWAYDGHGIRVWLNALAIEAKSIQKETNEPEKVKESVNVPLDFYPLSVLMDKGIIIGAEHETATRANLTFVMFRYATSSHLFLHHILRFLLGSHRVRDAVAFASHYKDLIYFAHALEILLHTVVESESTPEMVDGNLPTDAVLPNVVQFLDHFDIALDVVVGCARKTELTRWRHLFSIVGNPKSLFEACLASQRLKTAASYLLVLHNLEQLDENNEDVVRLLKNAVESQDWTLCRELLRFLHSVDDTGTALRNALRKTNIMSDNI